MNSKHRIDWGPLIYKGLLLGAWKLFVLLWPYLLGLALLVGIVRWRQRCIVTGRR